MDRESAVYRRYQRHWTTRFYDAWHDGSLLRRGRVARYNKDEWSHVVHSRNLYARRAGNGRMVRFVMWSLQQQVVACVLGYQKVSNSDRICPHNFPSWKDRARMVLDRKVIYILTGVGGNLSLVCASPSDLFYTCFLVSDICEELLMMNPHTPFCFCRRWYIFQQRIFNCKAMACGVCLLCRPYSSKRHVVIPCCWWWHSSCTFWYRSDVRSTGYLCVSFYTVVVLTGGMWYLVWCIYIWPQQS